MRNRRKQQDIKVELVRHGMPAGPIAQQLLACNMDVGALRPWLDESGRSWITLNHGGKPYNVPVRNANATLRRDDWIMIDRAVVRVAEKRLKAVSDIRSRGLVYTIPNGMGKTVLTTEAMSDVNDAVITMDGLRRGPNDRPEFEQFNLPLPIIHFDWGFSARQINVSRSGGTPLDTSMGERAGRKVAEAAEKLTLGKLEKYAFAGAPIYGLTNFPDRITKVLTSPEDSAWTPDTLVNELLDMRQALQDAHQYGPYFVYFSPAWDKYLDRDYSSLKGDNTLRERIAKIPDFGSAMSMDYLSSYEVTMCVQSTETVRMVVGLDVTTVQWETEGGMYVNFKTMAILVPQCRSDFEDQCGIAHGSVS